MQRLASLRRFFRLASSASLLLFSAGEAVGADAAGKPLRVVILSGTEVMLPASQVEDAAIRRTLTDAGLGPIEFYSEGMDAYRFRGEDFEPELVPFLQHKYGEKEPDLVFAITGIALTFLERYRELLWPNSPVVFTNVDQAYFDDRKRPSWATGVLDNDSVDGTVALARTLQPDARRIVLVTGVGQRETSYAAKVTGSLGSLSPRFEVVVRAGVPMEDFPKEFGKLRADTILLYTMMFRDSAGRSVVPRDAARALAAAASVPVYGTHSTFLGGGIVGGALFDYEYEARAAATMGVRVLQGESPGSIPILGGSPPLKAVDGRQLERFGIPESHVPVDYEIRFHTPSFWEMYRWRIVAVGVALGLETLLIIALLTERQSRKRAEDESRQRRQELAHAARLATIGELAASISHEINQPLGAILANAETAELLLDSKAGNSEELRQILTDIRRDDVRASEVMRRVRALAGRREIEMKPLDVNEVAEAAASLLEPEARRRGVGLVRDLRPGLPASRADEVSLQQIIINLALNGMEAMARTPAGRRRLTIATRSRGSRVVVRVSDTGHGIATADRPRLFESFFSTKEHGLGLGLSICRSIIEAHGGRISADNDIAGGATFEFELPALAPAAAEAPSLERARA
jgi:signal transduction histidine kinase